MPSGNAGGTDGPLFAWGEALRSARASRRRLRRRAVLVAIPALCALATAVAPPTPRLVWNASPSMPVGLYSVSPGVPAATGELVIAWPPKAVRWVAAERRYLPSNVPLVKRVAAMPGDEVCALGARIFINGEPSVARRAADRAGRPLPWWEGCVRLREGQRLLLVVASPDSFDGRYFGVSERADILGKARLLWAR
ncbi:S26 family signal peptidase [Sphingomonas canadensis]|uniref:S26 family signal peptidase n=1 Tax=Sphingomonas canadensis TaxID=1219257 RepID=A0ABW3H0V7_9SPHN|nr:S26 family signal peptidase [Sphingomonas canadensis]MCW3835040.1 S26 family signal peptidase [Sphingomonas canadensis]